MVNARWPNTNVQREHIQRLLYERLHPDIEWLPAIQLRRRHPQFPLRIDPHRIDPKQSIILNEHAARPVRINLDDGLPIRVAHIDVSVGIDRRTAGARRQTVRDDVRA